MFDPKAYVKTLPHRPGVYRMLDARGEVLYVGKARDLRKRVASYFTRTVGAPKTRAMLQRLAGIEVTVTHTENEALLLESNLIKSLRPRYNVLLRDDKSYPYIYCADDQPFPRLGFHRGARRAPGRYFGPYPSAGAVRETLDLLQKLFQVRQCEDSFYRNRSRPCLQHQIGRCSAPCVGLIDEAAYAEDVRHAILFLEGRNSEVIDELVRRMEAAAARLAYEEAARYRDQIQRLRQIQDRQYVTGERGDLDVMVCELQGGVAVVEVFFVRGGRNLGNKTFFPRHPEGADAADILESFLPQFYLRRETPAEILVNVAPGERAWLEKALAQHCGHRVDIRSRVRGARARWLELALANARQNLQRRLSDRAGIAQRFEALQEALRLDQLPQRLECFDISHTGGQDTVASCVVFDREGPLKSDYRRFRISDITPGDDYAAMRQALQRRYLRLKAGEGRLPDVLFIDGGAGQLRQASEVLEELQISGVTLVGVAKGRSRKPGRERLVLAEQGVTIGLAPDSPALHLIQQIRDEAHRFAITGHRQRRARSQQGSLLDGIPGIGPRRKRQLLQQFGGLQGVSRAGVEDLCRLPGINRELAQRIYDTFHG
ncbi:MAG TPA: excinuclease ABC subunit UvrC [Gammaproteobacteria bacterium]|nr:excinuclease ABC subunit UvrC [Gammaproteobacteria bacterium]